MTEKGITYKVMDKEDITFHPDRGFTIIEKDVPPTRKDNKFYNKFHKLMKKRFPGVNSYRITIEYKRVIKPKKQRGKMKGITDIVETYYFRFKRLR